MSRPLYQLSYVANFTAKVILKESQEKSKRKIRINGFHPGILLQRSRKRSSGNLFRAFPLPGEKAVCSSGKDFFPAGSQGDDMLRTGKEMQVLVFGRGDGKKLFDSGEGNHLILQGIEAEERNRD